MAEEQTGTVFGPKAVEQIARTVREVSRRMRNETPQRGRWQQRESSGGGHTMWFTIVDVHCPDDYDPEWYLRVTPLYYTGNCGTVPPGRQEDGYWYMYSLCGFDSDQVDSDLPGTVGWGTYFYPYTADSDPAPDCGPFWLIGDLCGLPECS